MASLNVWALTLVFTLASFGCLETVNGFKCYKCESNQNVTCSERFDPATAGIYPESCDEIFEARFCIKTTGMHGGQIGTKRYCAARDQGNYCEYVKRQGDDREYRSCIYTCYTEGCNIATKISTHWCFRLVWISLLIFWLKC